MWFFNWRFEPRLVAVAVGILLIIVYEIGFISHASKPLPAVAAPSSSGAADLLAPSPVRAT